MTAPRPSSSRPGPGRRAVLVGGGLAAGAAGASAVWALTGPSAAAPIPASPGISPDDDLMREHGVLKRVLLCYREMTRRVQTGQRVPAPDLHDAALIIHDYIEGFHEGLEEGYVFPRLRADRRAHRHGHHAAGPARPGPGADPVHPGERPPPRCASSGTRARLAAAMQAFVRMYEPHEAREDTVIFPAFRQVVPAAELADLGQHFADLERQQFGRDEFGAMVARVARIEQNLEIYDLNQFTPQVGPFLPGT